MSPEPTPVPEGFLDLVDWRRRIFELYSEIRATADPQSAWDQWRKVRDEMFAIHPQSPVPKRERAAFEGLHYFPYEPQARVVAEVVPSAPQRLSIAGSADSSFDFFRFGRAEFELSGEKASLDLYWLDAYPGGLFLSFRDETSGQQTYGACRYILDTSKGADLGVEDGKLVLDFNFSYNPSCAYHPRWACPLAPSGNRLAFSVKAGERLAP